MSAVCVVGLGQLSCGGSGEVLDATIATLSPVRGEVALAEQAAAPIARAAPGAIVEVGEGGLARVVLDGGPRLLVDRETRVELRDEATVALASGRLFAEVSLGDRFTLVTEQGTLMAEDASLSARMEGDTLTVYIVRGQVSFAEGEEQGLARAGERLVVHGGSAERASATLWQDWTGGLVRPGPAGEVQPEGVGMLEARVPDEIGMARWPLVVRRLDVRVRVESDLAITEVDQVFFNPASESVEGLYRIRVPEGAVLQRFAVDRDGRLVDGYVRERAMARAAYQAQVYRGSTEDPALLEWDAPGAYRARIYPIEAGATRRIVTRYVEWLRPPAEGAPRLYRYPMSGGPRIQELFLSAEIGESGAERVRAGLGAEVEDGVVELRRSDFVPRADFWLELVDAPRAQGDGPQVAWRAEHEPPPRAPDSRAVPNEADERDYFYLPLRLPERLAEGAREEGVDLVIVADLSAGTDRTHLELGRSVVESLSAHLSPQDRLVVVSADLDIRAVYGEAPALAAATPEHVETMLNGLARASAGGATDLGAVIGAAAGLLDEARSSAVIYVGDGAPTVGEMAPQGLLERLGRLPSPVRLYALGVGAEANLELLSSLTRGGGLAERVEERSQAAEAALHVLAHLRRPVAHNVIVELGDGIENPFPHRPMDAVVGDLFPVVGRVAANPPSEVVVRGTIGGREFEERIAVSTRVTEESTDLRLRWAGERLRQLLLDNATREEIAELGVRYGLITPFTSFYVPSRRELSQMGSAADYLRDQPLLDVTPRMAATQPGRAPRSGLHRAALLGPMVLGACFDRGDDDVGLGGSGSQANSVDDVAEETEEADEGGNGARHAEDEGAMGQAEASRRTRSRFGIEGPAAEPEPETAQMAREEAAPAPSAAAAMAGSWNSPTSPYGGEEAQGQDPMAAMGALMGDQVGANFGMGGLGLQGTGRGGGGTGEGTIGLGNLGTIGHGSGDGSGSGYGRGAGRVVERSGGQPLVRTGTAVVRGSMDREIVNRVIRRHINEVRFCYEQGQQQQPDLEGRINVRFIIAPTGAVQTAMVESTTLNNAGVESCLVQAVRRWTFPASDGGGIVVVDYPFVFSTDGSGNQNKQIRTTISVDIYNGGGNGGGGGLGDLGDLLDFAAHRRGRCSDAADRLLDDRRALWRERLSQEPGPAGWIRRYHEAIERCEAPTWRDRRAFLQLMIGRAGSVSAMIDIYRLLSQGAERGYLRSAVLRRVRTPDELREVREAFGLSGSVDWQLVEQVLTRAEQRGGAQGKAQALRRLALQYPESFDLKLRLLRTLEELGAAAEARRLAHRMRHDPLADPGVRTAIGEMYLRMELEDEARRVFSEIVEFSPLDELARRRLGDLYRAHGWYEDAYRQYQTLAEIRPDDTSVLLLQAQAAAGAGRTDEALRLTQRLTETAEPGTMDGAARTAVLWASVRYAELRKAARDAHDEERLEALTQRMRRSGVLRAAGALRVSLTWSHPDAQISLWAGHPGLSMTRPVDIAPTFGLEAFDLEEQEEGTYRFEVRRGGEDRLTPITAKLVVVWNEGRRDERIEVIDLRFEGDRTVYGWTLTGRALSEAAP